MCHLPLEEVVHLPNDQLVLEAKIYVEGVKRNFDPRPVPYLAQLPETTRICCIDVVVGGAYLSCMRQLRNDHEILAAFPCVHWGEESRCHLTPQPFAGTGSSSDVGAFINNERDLVQTPHITCEPITTLWRHLVQCVAYVGAIPIMLDMEFVVRGYLTLYGIKIGRTQQPCVTPFSRPANITLATCLKAIPVARALFLACTIEGDPHIQCCSPKGGGKHRRLRGRRVRSGCGHIEGTHTGLQRPEEEANGTCSVH
mmetsp:Transcript_34165/g.61227  ORF Transcript_34165/g.61227 Transcript_34165/m.61227 type:complete len:255 (-) Transcript_34165:685-1449(-)